MSKINKPTYAFIDAANLFYGGDRSLGWQMDYQRLYQYLSQKFNATKIFYYAGVDVDDYELPENKHIDLEKLVLYFEEKLKDENLEELDRQSIQKYGERSRFYKNLADIGFNLRIKPVKVFENDDLVIRKANCDVDLTFDLMRYISQYSSLVVMTGDGDFAPILEYLKKKHKEITIMARGKRTAKEIRKVAGDNFIDFSNLKDVLKTSKKVEIGKK